jgi:transcriptional regulator with XRE-family HTH domain
MHSGADFRSEGKNADAVSVADPAIADDVPMSRIGRRLRLLRESHGMTLREAARRSKLSHTFINMVESGNSEISFTRLIRLANAYGVLINELLVDVFEVGVEFIPAGQGLNFPVGVDGVELRYISGPKWKMQAFSVELQPGTRLETFSQAPEKFLYCVRGKAAIYADGERFDLNEGDTIYIPSYAEHWYANESDYPLFLMGSTERTSFELGAVNPRTT